MAAMTQRTRGRKKRPCGLLWEMMLALRIRRHSNSHNTKGNGSGASGVAELSSLETEEAEQLCV